MEQTEVLYYIGQETVPHIIELNVEAQNVRLGDVKTKIKEKHYGQNFKFEIQINLPKRGELRPAKKEITRDDSIIPMVDGYVTVWLITQEPTQISNMDKWTSKKLSYNGIKKITSKHSDSSDDDNDQETDRHLLKKRKTSSDNVLVEKVLHRITEIYQCGTPVFQPASTYTSSYSDIITELSKTNQIIDGSQRGYYCKEFVILDDQHSKPLEEANREFLEKLKNEWKALEKKGSINENKEQHPIFEQAAKILSLGDKYQLKHENSKLLKPKRPDFVFITKDRPSLLFAPFIVELQVGAFDNDHKGKVVKYNSMILETSVRRPSITSILTNLNQMIFVESTRSGHFSNIFLHEFSPPKNFWTSETSHLCGLHYIQQMLDTPQTYGYDDSLNFTVRIENLFTSSLDEYYINKFVGQGLTAHVYTLQLIKNEKETKDYIAKKFKNKIFFEQELTTIKEIQRKSPYSNLFIKYVSDQPEDLTIVYSPLCVPLQQRQLTKKDVLGIFQCLKELQRVGVIHRDLSPHHFMKRLDNQKIILIDFGSATFTETKEQLNHSVMPMDNDFHRFQGSLEFAADDIQKHLADPEKVPYTPHRRHDIESVIKTILFFQYGFSLPNKKKVKKHATSNDSENKGYKAAKQETKERAKQMIGFWEKYIYPNLDKFWFNILILAKSDSKQSNIISDIETQLENFSGYKWDPYVKNS